MKPKYLVFSLLMGVVCQSQAANLAIIDSGLDYKHKDLSAKVWTNPNSETTAGDGATYKDDTHGWNFADKNNQIIDYKYEGTFSADCYKLFETQSKILTGAATQAEKDWYKAKKEDKEFLKEVSKFGNFVHGTHVSGISSKDVDGARLMMMKIIATEPPGSRAKRALANAKEIKSTGRPGADNPLALLFLGMLAQQQAKMLTTVGNYVKAVKGEIANGSFGTSVAAVAPVIAQLLENVLGHKPTEQETKDYSIYFINEAIKSCKAFVDAAPDTLFVFAAGNDGTNNDELPASPANIKTDNTITVAATWGVNSLATFSNFGSTHVEVAAPGVAIMSTIPGDKELPLSGTSMAAPYVTNVAGSIKDANTALTPVQIKKVLMDTVDVKPFLAGKVKTSGIVNKKRAERAAELSRGGDLDSAIAQAKLEVADMPETELDRVAPQDQDVTVLPLPMVF